jgi:DNA modification methylase
VYQAKPSKRERNAGLDKPSTHPTVKPVALMRHLVRLVTPPGGTVLDPFAGSGTTLVAAVLEGMNAIGCEMTDEYLPIIEGRVAWAEEQVSVRGELAKAQPQQPTLL